METLDALHLLAGVCRVHGAGDADRVDGVPATVVASPASAQETSALMRACHQHDLAVVVRGHGTKLAWGRPPERLDVILDTTRLDALVEHSRGDLIATVGAGMPLARLQEQLAEGGHQLVVDDLVALTEDPTRAASDPSGSTLGGAMATGLAGPRRMWTGALRDLVIGVRLVRADGTIAKAGGKVVKNVAGYDLAKLLTGSYGTLAVITEVTVRLHPLPPAQRWVGTSVEPDRLGALLAHLVESQLVPQAVEVRARPGVPPAVVTLVQGTERGAEARATALQDELTELECSAQVHDVAPPWWGVLLHPGQRGGQAPPPGSRPVRLKATARLSGIPDLVAEAQRHGATLTGSAGTGVLHLALPPEADPATALRVIRATSTRLGGSTVVLDAAPDVKGTVDSWGPVPGLDLMRRVKQEFDPTRILSPGRFVGGL